MTNKAVNGFLISDIKNPEKIIFEAKRREAFIKDIEKMTMFDNRMMRCVFSGNTELVKNILKTILNIDFRIDGILDRNDYVDIEKQIQAHPNDRALYLDVYARDDSGTRYNFEIQNDVGRMSPERMRYNSSMLDLGSLKAGMDFKALPSTFVIVFCRKDLYKKGEPFYVLNRRIRSNDEKKDYGPLLDRSNIILVNGEYRGADDIGSLMEDFSQSDWKKIKNIQIKDAMMFYKEYEAGRHKMYEMFNKSSMDIYLDGEKAGLKKGLEQGIEQGREQNTIATILRGHQLGHPASMIAEFTGYSIEEVERIIKEYSR